MTRLALVLSLVATLPPAKPLDDDYVAVRKDVFQKLEAADANLPVCEQALARAQEQLQAAQLNINDIKAAGDELQRQKKVLDAHVQNLESIITGYTDENAFVAGWEEVDGVLGIGLGYVIGTGQCIGLAWVFNQPGFRQ